MEKGKRVIIQDGVFDLFPEFYRAIIIVDDIQNHASYKRIKRLLKKEIDRSINLNIPADDPRISSWDDAHRVFGSNPNTHPHSVKSLLKRLKPGQSLPFINSVVALFNYISIKYVIPCGGDNVEKIHGNLVLGLATGQENFVPLGQPDKLENPDGGEVIYYDDETNNVMCRRWNWRNGDITRIEPDTKKIVINVDCIPPISKDIGNQARDELAQLLKDHCDAKLTTSFLDINNREVILNAKE